MKYSFYRQDAGPKVCYMLDIFQQQGGSSLTLMVHSAREREDAAALQRLDSLKTKIENGQIDEIRKDQERIFSEYQSSEQDVADIASEAVLAKRLSI